MMSFSEGVTDPFPYPERGYEPDEALEVRFAWADRERVWLGPATG